MTRFVVVATALAWGTMASTLPAAAQDADSSAPAPLSGRADDAGRLPGGGPHEPKGFHSLTRRLFDGKVQEGWTDRGDRAFQLIEDASAPGSPPGVGRAVYRAGFLAGRGPMEAKFDIAEQPRALYLSFYLRLSDNWVGHPSGVNKVFHLWIGGSNRVYLSAQGKGRGPFAPELHLQGIPGPQRARNLQPRRVRGVAIRPNQWVRWEVLLYANSPGRRDASAEWWINGELAGRETGFALVGPDQKGYWEQVSWNPTWGGMGGTVHAPMFQDIDEIYVSVGR